MGSVILNVYYETDGFRNSEANMTSILSLLMVTIVVSSIFILELRTKIDATGITAIFYPFPFLSRKYVWSQIDKVNVKKYSPLTEYGGWGIRGLGEASAYNVSGNYGIQIVTQQNKRFLIGTKKPQDAERVLKKYTENIK